MTLPAPAASLRGKRIGVAGAGLAGLSAAWALQRRGADVTVFEARRRVGGRVLTVRGLPGAAHAEMGGDIIEEDDKDAISAMAEAMRLSLVRVLPGGFRYYRGSANRRGRMAEGSEPFDRLRALLQHEIDALKRADASPSSGIARSLGRVSALDWARKSRNPREAVAHVEALRPFFVAEPSEFSLLMLAQQLSEEGDPATMKLYRVAGGNGRLPEAIAASLARPVQLASRVLQVRTLRGRAVGPRPVTAVTDTHGARSTFTCDAFVIALPATLARKVDYKPALPAPQARAIASLPYGRATKALVSFDRRFWRRRGHAFATRLPVGAVWEAGAKGNGGTLAMLAGGDTSVDLANLAAAGTQRDWQRELRWLGIGDARVVDAAVYTWEKDPFALGAYAHQSPSFDPALLPLLAAPAGRIAFAGEHTSTESQGYMEGAVMSGLRAADDIEAMLRPHATR